MAAKRQQIKHLPARPNLKCKTRKKRNRPSSTTRTVNHSDLPARLGLKAAARLGFWRLRLGRICGRGRLKGFSRLRPASAFGLRLRAFWLSFSPDSQSVKVLVQKYKMYYPAPVVITPTTATPTMHCCKGQASESGWCGQSRDCRVGCASSCM